MGALVISRGDTIKDPSSGQELGDEIMVAEAYIVEVQDRTSKAILVPVRNQIPRVVLGDSIRFK